MVSEAKCQLRGHVLVADGGHRMVTNFAETVVPYVRPDMDIPYRAHVKALLHTG